MPNTITLDATTLTLPLDLQWTDELAWSPVRQLTGYSITGALLIEAATKQAGRPMTLAGGVNGAESFGLITRATYLQLQAWAALPAEVFALSFLGVGHSVIMDHERGAIEAVPLWDYANPEPGDLYVPTLRFLKV